MLFSVMENQEEILGNGGYSLSPPPCWVGDIIPVSSFPFVFPSLRFLCVFADKCL